MELREEIIKRLNTLEPIESLLELIKDLENKTRTQTLKELRDYCINYNIIMDEDYIQSLIDK